MVKMVRQKGFTLIELLIVIAVISIIIGITLPRFRGMQDEGSIVEAKGELRTIQTALESYYIHNENEYPEAATWTAKLLAAEPQIISVMPKDPFDAGNDYGYDLGGADDQYYVIWSDGPDGNGSAAIDAAGDLAETNGNSCIYFSNIQEDVRP